MQTKQKVNLDKFLEKIHIITNKYKNDLFKEIDKLDNLLNKEYNLNLPEDEKIKIINKIWKQQVKISTVKLSFEEVKSELKEKLKTIEELEKETLQREKTFNGMTAREWTLSSRNVWNDVSSPRKSYHKEHGAVYPYKLAERLIRMYSRKGDLVLDPFSGTATTINAAVNLGRNAIGIELSDRFFNLSKTILKDPYEFPLINHSNILMDTSNTFQLTTNETSVLLQSLSNTGLSLYKDDCRNVLQHVSRNSVQVLITSPPYADFIHKSVADREKIHKTSLIKHANNSTVKAYSDDERDLGNLEYKRFMQEIGYLMEKTYEVIKPGGYSIWVVKDYKDKENFTSYLDFHTDIAYAGKKVGFLYHDLIIWDQNEQRSLVLLGYPSKFHTNQNCSFLVILRKPDENEIRVIEKRRAENEY